MKKSKLSITLVTSFIAAMAMSACSSVSSSKDAIVTFTPYGTKESIDLITDDIYNQYGNTSAGISKFYEKILEVLIRYKFKNQGWNEGDKNYKEIENYAKNEVQAKKDEASANAKSNGTSYDDEWKSILKANNVEDSKELLQKFIYDEEKEVMKDWYATNNNNAEALKNEFIGVDATGAKVGGDEQAVKSAMPYHIRHILVKVDEASDAQEKFYKGTVSEDQAMLLYNTVTTLAEGKYTFAQVAKQYSEDGSASNGGDVGIMTNAASSGSLGMVNEFQLGIYAYDYKYDASHATSAAKAAITEGLGFNAVVDATGKTAEQALAAKITEVPYEAFIKMGKYAKVTADAYGNKLANGSSTVYPRNIIWNKYLNLHNVFLIKNRKTSGNKFNTATANEEFTNLVNDAQVYDANLKGFNNDGYLTDEKGNIIIGVRSQYGIHLMVIEKSMFDYTTLANYYSTKIPGEEGYTSDSYVGYISSQDKDDYTKRADDVKSKITSFDSTYDYRLFSWLTSDSQMQVSYTGAAEGLGEKIKNYIEIQQSTNREKQEEGLAKVWKTYTRMLGAQDYNRTLAPFRTVNPTTGVQSPYYTRLVSEKIADDFFKLYEGTVDATAYKAFAEGGDYYYYA